jgi:hypothetical protein
VHYDEELWLNRDGSGKAKIRLVHRSPYENPEEIMRKASLPGISLQKYDIARRGADVIYTIQFKFKSVDAFNNVNDQLGAADFWGKITLNKEPGRRITSTTYFLGSQEGEDDFESIFSKMQKMLRFGTISCMCPEDSKHHAQPENVDLSSGTFPGASTREDVEPSGSDERGTA